MDDDIKKLNEISDFFRRIHKQLILLNLLSKAKSEYDQYDYKNGRKTLIEAYLVDKNNPIVLRGLGCINQFAGKYNSAIRYYKKALKFSENKEAEYTLLGMAYYLQGKLDAAVDYFNLAIDINGDYDKAYEGRNQAMLEKHLQIVDLQESLKKYF